MTPLSDFGLALMGVAVAMILALPRRWAPIPLLAGTCYVTLSQGIEVGPFHFFTIRLILLAGLLRLLVRGERLAHGTTSLDWMVVVWSAWAILSGAFHADPVSAVKFNLGLTFDACGIYFLLRFFCQTPGDIVRLCRITVILLVPIAAEMIWEQYASSNLFALLGGVSEIPQVREGRVRAQGPFAHAILAGTVGAVCLPLAIGLWNQYRFAAVVGILTCATMVITSASSGPVVSAACGIGGLLLWRIRRHVRLLRWTALLAYLALDLVMKAPAYYLIARVDLAGGSSSWHRAELIDSAIRHLDEWWFAGTDYTRHWMPTGVSWSPDHTDITSQYIYMGVIGGVPLLLLFIAMLGAGFSSVGRALSKRTRISRDKKFLVWALGSSLFAHAATSVSVAYFDQSFVFLYLTLAIVGSAAAYAIPRRDSSLQPAGAAYSHVAHAEHDARQWNREPNGGRARATLSGAGARTP